MKVLYVEMAIGFGGSGKSMLELMNSLPGVEPFLLTQYDIRPFAQQLKVAEWSQVTAPAETLSTSPKSLQAYVATVSHLSTWTRAIIASARRNQVDLIHANNGVTQNLAAIIAARLTGIPLIVHQRGWQDRTRFANIARKLLGGGTVVAISSAVEQDLHACGLERSQVRQIYNVILPPSTEIPRRPSATIRVGMHGVLTPWKGHSVFIDAAAIVQSRAPGCCQFLIAGRDLREDGLFESELRKQVHRLGLDEHVQFDGHVVDVYRWLSEVDVNVHASIAPEPLGRVIVEAQHAGCAVIAANGGGATELVAHRTTGLLVPPNDPEALALALQTLAGDRSMLASLASAGRMAAKERFDTARLSNEAQALYRDVLRQSIG